MNKMDLDKADAKSWFVQTFEIFESQLDGSKDTPFHEIRKSAISRFAELGFPTPRNEEWKYTNVAPLLKHRFQLLTESDSVPEIDLHPYTFEGLRENCLVFINGQFNKKLSTFTLPEKNVIIENLKEALTNHPELILQHLAQYANFKNETFTALNTALTTDGVFVFIPENITVEEPLHVINLSVPDDITFMTHPRNLFVVGKNSQVTIVEAYHGLGEHVYFNNLVTEIVVEENAHVDHIKIQEENVHAFHISNTQVKQQRNSYYASVNVDMGGTLVRNNLNVLLNDEYCETHLWGFYLGEDNQHIDNHTMIDHAKPHCFSNELYKGILGGQARGVFNGKILVRPDAQKTNALQSNKTLLLTNDASINAKPQLEIYADDVKCTHGATIGQLDEEALFYLRSRGISEEMALAILRYAFISDVIENITLEPIRKGLDDKLIEKLKAIE